MDGSPRIWSRCRLRSGKNSGITRSPLMLLSSARSRTTRAAWICIHGSRGGAIRPEVPNGFLCLITGIRKPARGSGVCARAQISRASSELAGAASALLARMHGEGHNGRAVSRVGECCGGGAAEISVNGVQDSGGLCIQDRKPDMQNGSGAFRLSRSRPRYFRTYMKAILEEAAAAISGQKSRGKTRIAEDQETEPLRPHR